jgi:arsenic resistance protein ArsH
MRRASVSVHPDLPQLDAEAFRKPELQALLPAQRAAHAPRIGLLYGSLRDRSYSRLLTEEAARLLQAMGAETRIFDPRGLPLPDGAPDDHPKVQELRALAQWSEGMVWCSPERHGAMSGILKAQIDWIPLTLGAVALGRTPHSQSVARAGPLDAHADHSEPIVGGQGLS